MKIDLKVAGKIAAVPGLLLAGYFSNDVIMLLEALNLSDDFFLQVCVVFIIIHKIFQETREKCRHGNLFPSPEERSRINSQKKTFEEHNHHNNHEGY